MTSKPSVADSRDFDAVDLLLIAPGLHGSSSANGPPTDARFASAASAVHSDARFASAASAEHSDARFASAASAEPVEREILSNVLSEIVADRRFEHRRTDALPWEAELMICLGLMTAESASGAAIPAARLLSASELFDPRLDAPSIVMADPIALTPGRDEATLTPPEALALKPAELDDLFAAANDLLVDDGLAFVQGSSGRHYLTGLEPLSLDTLPTHALARRDIGRQLPPAADAGDWRRLMTEIQMLWHAHPVNERRGMSDRPLVNGIWFWGGATLPPPPVATPSVRVVTDDALAAALAAHAGVPPLPATTLAQSLESLTARTLVVVDLAAYRAWLAADVDALDDARTSIAARWIEPAIEALAEGRLGSLVVRGGDGQEASLLPKAPATPIRRLKDAWRSLVGRHQDSGPGSRHSG